MKHTQYTTHSQKHTYTNIHVHTHTHTHTHRHNHSYSHHTCRHTGDIHSQRHVLQRHASAHTGPHVRAQPLTTHTPHTDSQRGACHNTQTHMHARTHQHSSPPPAHTRMQICFDYHHSALSAGLNLLPFFVHGWQACPESDHD
jgi:hypothetical protein